MNRSAIGRRPSAGRRVRVWVWVRRLGAVVVACVLAQALVAALPAAAAHTGEQSGTRAHTGALGSCAAMSLVGSGGGFDVTYAVNEVGNLTQGPAGVYTYPVSGDGVARPHAPVQAGAVTLAWNSDGTLASRTQAGATDTYSWDLFDRLTAVDRAGTRIASMWYWPGGQRALLHEDSTVTLTLDSWAERTATTGGLTERRWYTIAGTVAGVQQHTPTGGVSWNIVLGDIRGSAAVTIARGTTTITSQWWTPYGERRGTRNDPIGTRGYLNQPEDSASGLTYLNHRYHDPRLGIFISVDPLITTTGEPYLYASGNPTTLSDPEGLCAGREGSRGGCGIDYFGGGGVDVNGGTGGAMRCGQGRHGLQGGACNSYGRTIDGDTWSTAANVAPRAGGPRIADGYWRPTPAAHRSGSCSWTCFSFAVSLAPVAGDAIDAFDCLNGSAVSCGVLPIPFLSGRVATGIDAMVQARRATNKLATGSDEAVFWSGIGRGGDATAASWAAKNGGATLESTMAQRGVQLPAWDASNPSAVSAWRQASADFASGASGNVRVLQGADVRIGSVWAEVEYPALINNPSVTSITSINPATGEQVVLWTRP